MKRLNCSWNCHFAKSFIKLANINYFQQNKQHKQRSHIPPPDSNLPSTRIPRRNATMSTQTTDGATVHNPICGSGAVWSPGWSHLPHSTADGDDGVAAVRAWGPGTFWYGGLSGYEVSVFRILNEVSCSIDKNPLPIQRFTEGSDAGLVLLSWRGSLCSALLVKDNPVYSKRHNSILVRILLNLMISSFF